MTSYREGGAVGETDAPPESARQHYLDESLRIAVWEAIFGSGTRGRIEDLLAEGARWRPEIRTMY
jgi:hypothetical protein